MPATRVRRVRRFVIPGAAIVMTALGTVSCGDVAASGEHHLASLSFPLFSSDTTRRSFELVEAREKLGNPRSTLTDEIEWATTVDEAFERATREDKPVLFATYVRYNAEPACDV